MAYIDMITYQLGDIHFGMYADRILEIVQFSGARAIPRPLPYIVGLTLHRKYLVTVVDFRKRLGLPPFELTPGITMIIAKTPSGMFGLLVDSLSHFKRVQDTLILPPISIAGFPEHLLRGVLNEGEDILMIPDIDKIFSSYIPVTLFPITPAEKIAFQYRFTPGALTKTLENTLMIQGYLDQIIVNKLPRSMCLPSVIVHKITSYYPDFLPKENISEPFADWHQPSIQEFKAGDERYLSLSQKLLAQQDHEAKERGETHQVSKSKALTAKTVHTNARRSETAVNRSPARRLRSGQDSGQESGRASPVRISSFQSYYRSEQQTSHRGGRATLVYPGQDHDQVSEERLLELYGTVRRVEELLHILNDEHKRLTHKQMRGIAQQYQIMPVKLAKLWSMFPNIRYIPDTAHENEPSEVYVQSPSESFESKNREQQPEGGQKLLEITRQWPETSVSRWMQLLRTYHLLTENQAIRYTATQLQIPTCRLSKFRSYYQLKIED